MDLNRELGFGYLVFGVDGGGIGRRIRLKIWFYGFKSHQGYVYGLMLSVALIRLRLWV